MGWKCTLGKIWPSFNLVTHVCWPVDHPQHALHEPWCEKSWGNRWIWSPNLVLSSPQSTESHLCEGDILSAFPPRKLHGLVGCSARLSPHNVTQISPQQQQQQSGGGRRPPRRKQICTNFVFWFNLVQLLRTHTCWTLDGKRKRLAWWWSTSFQEHSISMGNKNWCLLEENKSV